MNKVAIRNTTRALTIVRKTNKTIILKTDAGLIEAGTFPLNTEVKVDKIAFNPKNYGEDTEFQAIKVLSKKTAGGWDVHTGDRSLLSIVTDSGFRVGNKYQLVVLVRSVGNNKKD